jgi:transcriptional regulator with XRE-family HTH domain
MRKPTPTIRRWELGRQLRQLRENAGVDPKTAAAEIDTSTSTLSRIESGKQTIKPAYVKLLGLLYDVDAQTRSDLLVLAEEAGQPEWHTGLSKGMPEWFRLYLGYEAAASVIRSYCSELVDGLLQAPEYIRAIAHANRPDSPEAVLDKSAALRQGRQARLTDDDPPELHVVLNEAVLRRIVGSAQIMRGQLEHLAEAASHRHVTVQVLPFTAGAHPAMTAPFTQLGFSEPWDSMNTIYLENGRGALYLEGPADLERYAWMFDQLTALALSPKKSRDLLITVARDL